MSILTELWYGIKPVERNPWESKKYKEISDKISKENHILIEMLSDEQKAQYEKVSNLILTLQSIVEEEVFEQGFKLGAQIVIAATREDRP